VRGSVCVSLLFDGKAISLEVEVGFLVILKNDDGLLSGEEL
jgi:hypothetical protein